MRFNLRTIFLFTFFAALFSVCFTLPQSQLHIVAALVAIYLAKLGIRSICLSKFSAMVTYLLSLGVLIPYLYAKSADWDEPQVFSEHWWFGMPFAAFTVPTLSFVWDTSRQRPVSANLFLMRSLLELLILTPIWMITCALLEFYVLGWIWI